MSEPPLRIVVVGNSMGLFVRPPRERAEDGPYAEVLERELLARGWSAQVTNSSSWTLLLTDALRRVEPLVLHHSPRVAIINFGLFECQTITLPTSVFRWLNHPYARGGVARAVRQRVGLRVIAFYKWMTPRLPQGVPFPKRTAPQRFEEELRSLVSNIRKESGAEVLLLTNPPPGARIAQTLRDIEENAEAYSAIIREVGTTSGPGVHVVELAPIARALPLEESMPDGLHFSVEGHRLVGRHLADEVEKLLGRR
jgi:lysophospholipase L1-like esterase